MNKTNFILEDFDLNNLSGRASTTCYTTALSELEAIQQACHSQSQQMPEGYKVEHDGREFKTQKMQNVSGDRITNITFGFDLKTED